MRITYRLDGGYIVKEWLGIWVTIARDIQSYKETKALCVS